MILRIKRLLLNIFGRFIATDHFSKRFPVSVKGVVIVDNKVLLLKNERGEWDLPGGKLDASENLEECLVREMQEEVNVKIEVLTLHKAWKRKILNQVEVLILVYHCELLDEIDKIQISYEHSEMAFFKLTDLVEINIDASIREVIEKVFYNKLKQK